MARAKNNGSYSENLTKGGKTGGDRSYRGLDTELYNGIDEVPGEFQNSLVVGQQVNSQVEVHSA